MPLGLARDSMLNLAELAHQKEAEEGESSSPHINLEDGEEGLVMRLSTGEIQPMKCVDNLGNNPADDEMKKYPDETETETETRESFSSSKTFEDTTLVSSGRSEVTSESTTMPMSPSASEANSMSAPTEDSPAEVSHAAPSPSAPSPVPGQYAGFSPDYHDYAHYGDYTMYGTDSPAVLTKKEKQGFWCCLFPWLLQNSGAADDDTSNDLSAVHGEESLVKLDGRSDSAFPRSISKDDDEISTGSDMFGEKLSDKDRQAVLARLRLAQPDSSAAPTSPEANPKEKGLLNGIVQPNGGQRIRGILKRPSTLSHNNLPQMNQMQGQNGEKRQRRSLFPQYEKPKKDRQNLKTEFSPMARVLTVKSHKDMDEEEKSEIWWQRSDYEAFRKTGRMITKAMLEGGSEIWLATNKSWQTPNTDKQSTLKHAVSLAERHAAFVKGDVNAKKEYEETRDKWWHRFGHSRRGLEHIASIDEGRQRQANVRTAIKAVIDEQRRQRVFHREDPEKLRMVSIQHTSWAKDLALAAGASDQDAVQMNFDDESRKSREFYLLKFSRSNQANAAPSTQKSNVPAFMRPALGMNVTANRLDANTVSQIRFRQAQKKKTVVAPSPATPPRLSTDTLEEPECVPLKVESPVSTPRQSMAKKAAGYASGEEVGNMSAVLTGMGAIPKQAATVGGP